MLSVNKINDMLFFVSLLMNNIIFAARAIATNNEVNDLRQVKYYTLQPVWGNTQHAG